MSPSGSSMINKDNNSSIISSGTNTKEIIVSILILNKLLTTLNKE